MARTKQTARKTSGGKLLAMGRGRGKGNSKSDPKPGGRLDRKVVIEYSSDESLDEDNPHLVGGAGAPKRMKKQIHLTLPTSPAHVTKTESFAMFFINHGLTKALWKAFEKRGWSTDQMQDLITNFQKKHGKKVPLPKLYMDEDSSDSEGLELADGTRVGRNATDGAVALVGASQAGSPQPTVAAVVLVGLVVAVVTPNQVQEEVELVVLAVLVVAQEEVPSVVQMTTLTMIPTRGGKPVTLPNHQGYQWLGRNLEKASPRMADSTSDQG